MRRLSIGYGAYGQEDAAAVAAAPAVPASPPPSKLPKLLVTVGLAAAALCVLKRMKVL